MNQQLDPAAGAILKQTMEEMGVTVHSARYTAAVLGEERVTGLAFKDGTHARLRHGGDLRRHPGRTAEIGAASAA